MSNKLYFRYCPICNKKINYVNKYTYKNALINKTNCKKCASKINASTPEFKKRVKENYKKYLGKIDKTGENNPFYGKKHTKETKYKISRANIGKKLPKGVGFQKGCIPNKIPVYDCWLKKYGKKEADRRDKIRKKKLSIAFSGKNNPNYGKPSPQGSGNGWSGWYKDSYFRSLLELSYIVNYIEKESLSFISGECNKYKIEYIDQLGKTRNYFPDYIIEDREMVEVKPKRLHDSPSVVCKKMGAVKFCKNNNLIYNLIEPKKIKFEQIKLLYEKGLIKWLPRYKEKYEKYIDKTT